MRGRGLVRGGASPHKPPFTTSFKTAEEYGTTNAMALPQNWLNFSNYAQVWTEGDMLRAFLTSASVVVVVVAVSVMMGSMLAYVLNRFRFPGNGLIRNLFMIATLIPGIAMQVTTYQIMKDLGFLNSIVGYMFLMSGTDVISISSVSRTAPKNSMKIARA